MRSKARSNLRRLLVALLLVAIVVPVRADNPPVIKTTLLVAASVLNTTTNAIVAGQMGFCRESAIYVSWSTGVSSGAVTIESAVDETYASTWAPLQVVTYTSGSPKQDIVQITGVHWALRTRVSTVLAGGTVSTWLVCN